MGMSRSVSICLDHSSYGRCPFIADAKPPAEDDAVRPGLALSGRAPVGHLRSVTTTLERERGLRLFAPFSVPAMTLGLSFGVVAARSGFDVLTATVMSLTTYAGSAQFAAVTLLGAGTGVPIALAAATLLNLRYLAMGIAVAPWFEGPWWRRLAESQMIVDASWAVGHRPGGGFDSGVMCRLAVPLLVVWVGGEALGAHFASPSCSFVRFGLDACVPAMFLGLLWLGPSEPADRRVAIVAAAVALATTPFTPPGMPV